MAEMDQQKRLMIALALSFGVTAVYMMLFAPKPQPETAQVFQLDAGTQGAAPTPPPAPLPTLEDGGEALAVPPPPPPREFTLTRAEGEFKFNTEGGGLSQAKLAGPKMREQPRLSLGEGFALLNGKNVPDRPQIDMAARAPGHPLSLALSLEGSQPFPADARYRAEESADQVVFSATQGGWEVVKTLTFLGGYEARYTVSLKNVGPLPFAGDLGLHYTRAVEVGTEEKGSFMGGVGNESKAACLVDGKLHQLAPGDDPKDVTGPVHFFGVDQQYFLGAVFSTHPLPGRCTLTATPSSRTAHARFPVKLAPGEKTELEFGVYIGPKDGELLASVPAALPKPTDRAALAQLPRLQDTVDYGWFEVICKVLLGVLRFFHGVTHNWGVAIILLTVSVKLVLLPLTHKSMVSAEQMKKLQPKMEELRKKFADDPQRQNMEMMKLYQEAKVNPFSGCWPLLVQMPIWIALFTTLRNSFEIYGEPFVGPIWFDLTYKDPTYLLPLALGATMIVTQRLQPQMMDNTQAKIMTYGMPVFFTAIMLNYPAGLALYIFTNNVLSIAQQYGLKRYLAAKGA